MTDTFDNPQADSTEDPNAPATPNTSTGPTAIEDMTARAAESLKQTWVTNYEGNVGKAKAALGIIDPHGSLAGLLEQTGYGDDPGIVAMLVDAFDDHAAGESLEGANKEIRAAIEFAVKDTPFAVLTTPGGPSKEQAQAAIKWLQADPRNPYWTSKYGSPIHRMGTMLFQYAFGEDE